MKELRIISLIASATEIVCALGFEAQLIGRSHECDFPLIVKQLPVCTSPKFEVEGLSYEIDQRVKAILQESLSVYRVDADLLEQLQPTHIITQSQCEVCAVSFKDVEAAYYRETGIFPIMHVVALKRSLYEAHPWVAKTLTKAFARSLELAYEPLRERSALRYMLPWLEHHVEETEELMGAAEWWQDGFAQNRHVIEKFLDYHYAQGLSKRRFQAEELFAPNALETFVL